MIWHWLVTFARFVVRLFKMPDLITIARIDANARCPVCGHRHGELRAVDALVGNQPGVACLHICLDCGARWFEPAVVKKTDVIPSKDMVSDAVFVSRLVTKQGAPAKEETF